MTGAAVLVLAACGGNSGGPPLTLSGTISGLTTDGLALTTNGVNLAISAGATSFTFGPVLADTIGYDVTAPIQPSGQLCTVANGTGTATTANISNVVVTCSDRTFTVGGTISGLTVAGLVLANGSDTLSVPAGASSFTMPAAVAYGSSYAVTVSAQPTGLACNVTSGAGTMAAAAVTNVAVACTAKPLSVGGRIDGLGSASGLVLANGAETYQVPPNATSFALDTPAPAGSPYRVRVQTQPAGLICSVSNGPGTMPAHDVGDVSITCSDQAYTLGGSVDGLTAAGLVLSDGSDLYPVPANASTFTLPAAVARGAVYRVTVHSQPAGLTCTPSDAAGTMPAGDVTNIAVTCDPSGFTLGGSISGLATSGLVLTDGVESLSVAANAARFSMPSAHAYGSHYAVSIRSQPSGADCRIADGAGSMTGEVDTIRVACRASAPPAQNQPEISN